MIPNEEKEGCHYLTVKELSAILHEITSNHKDDFYCLNCLHYFRTESANDEFANNKENSSKTKIGEHIPCNIQCHLYRLLII